MLNSTLILHCVFATCGKLNQKWGVVIAARNVFRALHASRLAKAHEMAHRLRDPHDAAYTSGPQQTIPPPRDAPCLQ